MPRARSTIQADWQTAAPQENGSGCLSLYSLSILSVFLITCLITALALNTPVKISAASPNQPASSTHQLSPIFTREVQHWADAITRWANASALDPNLVAVVMQIESCGDPSARSSAGAMGLFQVMPFHFQLGENSYDPEINALRGLNYLTRSLQAANGDARLALAGYNGGIGVISRGEWSWHAQTKRYVYYGAPIYADARSGATTSPMLDEWYRKYGAGLCRDASQKLGLN
jgi:soluble lytic murein transglycosylase-like protein